MAEQLENFDFEQARTERTKRTSPLDKFLDGNAWKLTMNDALELEQELGYTLGSVYRDLGALSYALRVRHTRLYGKNKRLRTFSDKEAGYIVVQVVDKND